MSVKVEETERRRTLDRASKQEKNLSRAVSEALDIEPTHTGQNGIEWPIVQRVGRDMNSKTYAFWLDEYGVLGSVGEEGERWATAHAEDGDLIEEGFDNVRDAALAAADLESET